MRFVEGRSVWGYSPPSRVCRIIPPSLVTTAAPEASTLIARARTSWPGALASEQARREGFVWELARKA